MTAVAAAEANAAFAKAKKLGYPKGGCFSCTTAIASGFIELG